MQIPDWLDRDVALYASDYKPIKDVPIVNASAAYTDKESVKALVVLQFNQVLWYSKKSSMSLFNPNQRWHLGLTVSDNPTDKVP
jgi:hypothetical protein